MRLGYIYTVTSGGYDNNRVRINAGSWSSVVRDERRLWLSTSINGEAVAMTFVKDGIVLAVAHVIGGDRDDDNITTWIFVPLRVRLSGSQLEKIIEAVKEINRAGTSKVSEDTFTRNDLLNADFEECEYPISWGPSHGVESAVRYPTDNYSMEDILSLPYQEYYTRYKYIFLLNSGEKNRAGLKNLSEEDIFEYICVLPPSSSNILNVFGEGSVAVKFTDGRLFNSPVMARKGETFDLVAEKADCHPIKFMAQASAEGQEVDLLVESVEWKPIAKALEVIEAVARESLDDKARKSRDGKSFERGKFGWKEFGYGVACGLLIAAICWGGVTVYNSYFGKETSPQVQSVNSAAEGLVVENDSIESVSNIKAALAYLDSHDVWHRDSLSAYPELNGLFEELNNYELDKILARDSVLIDSKNFNDLCVAIRSMVGQKPGGTYNTKPGDVEITVSRYIKKLGSGKSVRKSSSGVSESQISSEGLLSKTAKEAEERNNTKKGDEE